MKKKIRTDRFRFDKLKALTAILVSLSCLSVYSEEFSPLASAKIQLDSPKSGDTVINMLNNSIHNPSEYRKTTAGNKKTFDTTSAVDDFFAPPDEIIKKSEMGASVPAVEDSVFYPPEEVVSKSEPENTKPTSDEDYVYYPPEDTAEKALPPVIEEKPKKETVVEKENPPYTAKVEEASAQAYDTAEFEGKTITEIDFQGLKLINKKVPLSVIKTRKGAVFNAQRLQEDLQKIYSLGYFTDSMTIEPELNKDGTVKLVFTVQENIPINDVDVKGNTVFTTKELLPLVEPLKGLPQNIGLINEYIDEITHYYHSKGYTLAGVSSIDDDSNGCLTFNISEGIIDKIVYDGNKKTKNFIIDRNVMTQPGTVYNEELLKKDLAKIYSTQIFEEVNQKVDPSPNKDGEYIVTIKVKEASSDSISVGGGLDSALGVFGSLNIRENNFRGKGQQVSLGGMLGSGILLSDSSIKNRMNYQVELCFKEPHFINSDNSLISKIYLREMGSFQVPLAVERRFGYNGVVRHKVHGHNNLETTLGLGYENIHLREGDINKITKLYASRNINFARREQQLMGGDFVNVAPGVQYSSLDSDFMPRSGIIAKANYIESLSVGDLKKTSGRAIAGITKYIPILKKSSLAIGMKGGAKVHGSDMPEVMAFNLGGPYSIRGFRMSGVGTGDAFIMGSAELQTPIPFMDRLKFDVLKNLRFAFFVDAGRVFEPTVTSALFDRPNSAITAGVGIRINIPGLGPISVDYGLPFTHVGRYNSKRGYFTFGTGGLYDNY